MVVQPAKFPGTKQASRLRGGAPSVELARPVRPLMQSVDDPTLMARQRTKIALINSLYCPPDSMPREFSSYYKSPSKTNKSYNLISHENPQKNPTVFSTFSTMLQKFKKEPAKIVSFQEASVEAGEDSDECQDNAVDGEYDPIYQDSAMYYSSDAPNHRVVFKDNIVRFSDQATMTRKLNNAGCGSHTPISYYSCATEASSASTTHVGVQESSESSPLYSYQIPMAYEPPHEHHLKNYPPPILKKPNYHDRYVKLEPPSKAMEAEKEMADPLVSEHVSKSQKSQSSYAEGTTRILYNEGIDDYVKDFRLPMRPLAPTNVYVKYNKSKVTIAKPNGIEAGIPYSHRCDSKYHSACRDPLMQRHHHHDEDRKPFATVRASRTYQGPSNQTKKPYVPRRVLPSDQDIDTYIDICVPKLIIPRRI